MRSPRFLEEYKDIYYDAFKRTHSLIVDGYWHLKANRTRFKTKFEDFTHIQNASEAALDFLEILIDAAEGQREKPGVQPLINEILDTINIHLNRIKKYYPNNDPKTFKTKEHKREEGKFQQTVFKGELKITSKLKDLNIDNNMDGFEIHFFNDEIATLPMKDVLCNLIPEVAAKVESLNIDWDLIMDNGMYINMPKRDIPDYNSKKHFWDQEEDVLQFYVSEWNKIKHGVTIDGYYIHGWLYDHLNYFKTPIGNQGDEILNPPLRDNEWYWHEILKDAEAKAKNLEDAGVFIFGTRRFSKSTCEASMVYYKLKTNPAKNGTLTATNSEDLASITDKINIALEYCHPAFYINTTTKDWTKIVKLGLKTKGGRELKLFYLNIINTDSGSKRGGQKTAGGAPVVFVMDEAGKEDFLKSYNAAIPSFETASGWKCTPMYVGCVTAGTKVWDNQGNLLNIEDLHRGQGILGFNLENQNVSRELIIHKQGKYKKPCYELITNTGRSIRCSDDHPLLYRSRNETYGDKKRRGKRKEYFKKTKDFKEGDQVAIIDSIPIYGEKEIWEPYLVGLLIGDGSYGPNKTPVLSNCDVNINEYVYSNFDCVEEKRYLTKDNQIYKETRIRGIRHKLRELGIIDQTKENKTLPLSIHSCKKEDIFKLLSGLIDADGTINLISGIGSIQITFGYEKLSDEVLFLLNRVGVHGIKTFYKPNKNNPKDVKGCYRLSISDKKSLEVLYDNLTLLCNHKRKNLEKINIYQKNKKSKQPKECINRRFERVVSVKYIGEEYVYNLTAGSTHTYIANGFITHNTGGETDLSVEAEKVLSDPKVYRFIEMDWDLLEWQVPKEAITWTRRKFGWFIPAQMGYKKGFKRIKRTFADFLDIESEELSKITILQTDWITNTEVCRQDRERVKTDKVQLQQEIVFYPLDPEECFMSAKQNPFPASGLKRHKEKLQAEGDKVYGTARKIGLKRSDDDFNKIEMFIDTDREVNEYPHNGSFTDCPFLLFDDFPEERPNDPYRFVAGLDDYKQDESEGDSIGAFYIFDRLKRKIVLSLANRPDPHTDFHRQMHMALDAWNCKCFMENEDMDFKKYLDRVSEPAMYLYTGFDAYDDFSKFQNGKRKFGWRPDKNTVPIVRGYSVDYTRDDVDYFDNDGNVTHTVAGYERIEDIQLLEEMIKYKPEGNFDRLVAFGSCLAIDYYLTCKYITPMSFSNKKDDSRPEPPKKQRNKFFTQKRRSPFSR